MSSNLSELWASGDLPQKKKIQSLVFPSGIGYDKLKGKVQTKRVNSIFSAIPLLSMDLAKIKSGEPVNFNQFSALVTPTGHKPYLFRLTLFASKPTNKTHNLVL